MSEQRVVASGTRSHGPAQEFERAASGFATAQVSPEISELESEPESERGDRMADGGLKHLKPPEFSGKGAKDSREVQQFLYLIELFFGNFREFVLAEVDEDDLPEDHRPCEGLIHRFAVLALRCFPLGSHSAIWFQTHSSSFVTWKQFTTAFAQHFGASASDLVAVQSQWTRAIQRPSDSVQHFYSHLLKLQSQLLALGHDVSEQEVILRFETGLLPHLRIKVSERRVDPVYTADIHALFAYASVVERNHKSQLQSQLKLRAFDERRGKKPADSKWCFYCKSKNHNADDCRIIAKKKEAGTWKDKLPQ